MRSPRNYRYHTNCTEAPVQPLIAMIGKARRINYRTLLHYVLVQELAAVFPSYEWGAGDGLRLKDDYAVSFYRSVYRGRPCVYVCHSAIKYIFVKEGIDGPLGAPTGEQDGHP